MKRTKFIVALLVILFIVLLLFQMKVPEKFNWTATYNHGDSNPLGCQIFDTVVSSTMKKGYEVKNMSLTQLVRDCDSAHAPNVLVVTDRMILDDVDFKAIHTLTKWGCTVSIITGIPDVDYSVDYENSYQNWDSLFKEIDSRIVGVKSYIDFTLNQTRKLSTLPDDTIAIYDSTFYKHSQRLYSDAKTLTTCGIKPILYYSGLEYYVNDVVEPLLVITSSESYKASADYFYPDYNCPVATKSKLNNGYVILSTLPNVFTNYGILEKDMHRIIFKVLSYSADRKLVRLDHYCDNLPLELNDGENHQYRKNPTLLRYLTSTPSLRWALIITMITLILGMFFTIRRKQRVIPVVKEEPNHALDMVNSIGTLYYQTHDNIDLLKKKYKNMTEILRQTTMFDVDEAKTESDFDYLSLMTGIEKRRLFDQILTIKNTILKQEKISDNQLIKLVGYMNDILKSIKH